eukprot:c31114_g1_i1 orf=138-368(-)
MQVKYAVVFNLLRIFMSCLPRLGPFVCALLYAVVNVPFENLNELFAIYWAFVCATWMRKQEGMQVEWLTHVNARRL